MSVRSFAVGVIAALAAFAPAANAHFFMANPANVAGTTKSPLDPSGADFPCHGADLSSISNRQSLTAGSQQTLEFDLGGGANTAVHGGGSCQLSLTYETDAQKLRDPASWKVIHSFLEGCPTNFPNNLPVAVACTGSDDACVNSLPYTLPAEVKNGNAILAWTWFNNIGNREMYMTCAGVSISGGSDQMSDLPSLFVANLASVNPSCTTTENVNVQFPNPGKYVTYTKPDVGTTKRFPLSVPAGCGSSSGGSPSDSTPVESSSSASSESSTAVAAPTSSTDAATPTSATLVIPTSSTGPTTVATRTRTRSSYSRPSGYRGNNGGIFAPGASEGEASATAAPTSAETPAASQTAAAEETAAPSATASPSSGSEGGNSDSGSGSCRVGQVTCTANGFYCIDSTSFGLCTFGCATPMRMASGTSCISDSVKFAKRSAFKLPPQARRLLSLF